MGLIPQLTSYRMEVFSNNNLTVFSDSFESLQFARQLAAIKNAQADSKPFYVMDVGRVNELLDIWNKFLPRVQPFYAINCNDDAVLLKVLADNPFVGFQCQTKQNVEKVLEFSSPDRLLYSNACWTRSGITHACAAGIRRLSFDNARDLRRLVANFPDAQLILNVCVNASSEDMNAQLGCALNDASELLQLAADLGAQCIGLSFNVGSACTNLSIYEKAIDSMARLFKFAFRVGLALNVLNIGSGFSHLHSVVFTQICEQINKSLDYYFPVESYPQLQIIATPGRFLAESVFLLVTSVTGRRCVDASHVTNDNFDTGTKAFIYETNEGYYGSFGCRINANCNPQCAPLFDDYVDCFASEHVYGSVLGPTLDERFDVVQSLCRFRPLCIGEWLMWENMGAYSLNNYGNLEDEIGEVRASSPTIFYFASQDDWKRLQRHDEVFVNKTDEILRNIKNKNDCDLKMLKENVELFYDELDEGIGACLSMNSDLEELASTPSETGLSSDDEDFLIGLDDFFDNKNDF